MSDLVELLTAIMSLLGLIGSGVVWLWRRVEKGFAEMKIELAKCQRREAMAKERDGKHITVIELLWQEVERRSRGASNPVLDRARKLLDDLKKKEPDDD